MKLSHFLAVGVAAVLTVATASAQTQINITGSTAFRSVAHDTLVALMTNKSFAYTEATLGDSNQAIFIGNFPGISGTTTVRTSFAGSSAGVAALANNIDVKFLPSNTTVSPGGTPNTPAGSDPAQAQFAFSDVFQNSTASKTPVLSNTNVAVVPFIFVANEGAPAALDTMTDQLFAALYSTGTVKLSAFTGNSADMNTNVYPTGRNSSSGTRITALAETGYGVTRPVQQFTVNTSGVEGNAMNPLKVDSLTFGTNGIDGNGGYSSGSTLRDVLGATSATAIDPNTGTQRQIYIIGYIGADDSTAAVANGAKLLNYNGVPYSVANVNSGKYTFWGFEHLYDRGSLTGATATFKTNFVNGIPANLGVAGLPISGVKAARTGGDGGPVTPN